VTCFIFFLSECIGQAFPKHTIKRPSSSPIIMLFALRLALFLSAAVGSDAFLARLPAAAQRVAMPGRVFAEPSTAAGRPEFTISVVLPQKGITEYGTANMKFPPVLNANLLGT
jgi:hypothetical protein